MRKNEEDIAGAWKAEILREMKKAGIMVMQVNCCECLLEM